MSYSNPFLCHHQVTTVFGRHLKKKKLLICYYQVIVPKTFILCIYRLAKGSTQEYREILERRITDQLTAVGEAKMSCAGADSTYYAWLKDTNYLKLVAATDMYMYRFKHHEKSELRIGTLGSRYRDCAALSSFGYALKIGLKPN